MSRWATVGASLTKGRLQLILINHRFCICKLACLLRFIHNPQIVVLWRSFAALRRAMKNLNHLRTRCLLVSVFVVVCYVFRVLLLWVDDFTV